MLVLSQAWVSSSTGEEQTLVFMKKYFMLL